MELGWPDNRPDAKGAGDRAQLRELRGVENKVPINAPWQGEHSHKREDSLCMNYALYSNETTKNSVEIF